MSDSRPMTEEQFEKEAKRVAKDFIKDYKGWLYMIQDILCLASKAGYRIVLDEIKWTPNNQSLCDKTTCKKCLDEDSELLSCDSEYVFLGNFQVNDEMTEGAMIRLTREDCKHKEYRITFVDYCGNEI